MNLQLHPRVDLGRVGHRNLSTILPEVRHICAAWQHSGCLLRQRTTHMHMIHEARKYIRKDTWFWVQEMDVYLQYHIVKTMLVQLVNKQKNTKEAKHTYSKIKHIKHQTSLESGWGEKKQINSKYRHNGVAKRYIRKWNAPPKRGQCRCWWSKVVLRLQQLIFQVRLNQPWSTK